MLDFFSLLGCRKECVIARPVACFGTTRPPTPAPFHQRAIPRSDISFSFLVPPPQYQARALEGGRRPQQPRRAASPIAPSTATRRISHPSIQPPSPHLADTHGRAAAAAAGPSRLVSSLPDLQLLPCRFATFFVLFPSHLLDLILLNLRKSFPMICANFLCPSIY